MRQNHNTRALNAPQGQNGDPKKNARKLVNIRASANLDLNYLFEYKAVCGARVALVVSYQNPVPD